METLVSKWLETREQVNNQRDALVTRARDAGESIVAETRGASRELASFVGREAKRWRRYLVVRVTALEDEVRTRLDVRDLERRVLVTVGRGLRSLDARVHDRLAHIGGPATRTRRKRARKVSSARPRRVAA